jgi:type IV pilus assembly protein PilB
MNACTVPADAPREPPDAQPPCRQPSRSRLRQVLYSGAYLDGHEVDELLQRQEEAGGSLYEHLAMQEDLTDEDRAAFFCELFEHLAYVDASRITIPRELMAEIPRRLCEKHTIFPIARVGPTVTIAVANPLDINAVDAVASHTRCHVLLVVSTEDQIAAAIDASYHRIEQEEAAREQLKRHAASEEEMHKALELAKRSSDRARPGQNEQEECVVRLVELILNNAIHRSASDVHIEPFEAEFRLRYRQDGKLIPVIAGDPAIARPLVSRIKIMSNLDIAEHRVPQDGRMKLNYEGRDIDFRVSILPTSHGEKVVLRILDKEGLTLDFTALGFEPEARDMFLQAIEQPNGICLVTGPTGSGKSTTLYSALNNLNREDANLVTLEDPVEYNIYGINQVQHNAKTGMTFASGLRSILRQDPDVVMVGEIRDRETADIAIKAALTGHLVLSTLHTNDAPSAISRLIDMGVEPFLLSASLNLAQAQRLVRKICENCKKPIKPPHDLLDRYHDHLPEGIGQDSHVYHGTGCEACSDTGYRGRTCVVEMMPVTPEIKALIADRKPIATIIATAREQGMISLLGNGLRKAFNGITTIEEVLRVTST